MMRRRASKMPCFIQLLEMPSATSLSFQIGSVEEILDEIYRTPELDENAAEILLRNLTFFLKRIVEHAAGDAALNRTKNSSSILTVELCVQIVRT